MRLTLRFLPFFIVVQLVFLLPVISCRPFSAFGTISLSASLSIGRKGHRDMVIYLLAKIHLFYFCIQGVFCSNYQYVKSIVISNKFSLVALQISFTCVSLVVGFVFLAPKWYKRCLYQCILCIFRAPVDLVFQELCSKVRFLLFCLRFESSFLWYFMYAVVVTKTKLPLQSRFKSPFISPGQPFKINLPKTPTNNLNMT